MSLGFWREIPHGQVFHPNRGRKSRGEVRPGSTSELSENSKRDWVGTGGEGGT